MVLKARGLFFCALAFAGGAGAIFKHIYFPEPSVGMIEMLLALFLWLFLWHLERRQKILEKLADEDFQVSNPSLTLLRIYSIGRHTLTETLRLPLQTAMIVLWGWGMFRLGYYLTIHSPTPVWILNSCLATLAAILLLAYFRLLFLWPIPVLMGLGTLLINHYFLFGINYHIFGFIGAVYGLVIWIVSRKAIASPHALRFSEILLLREGNEKSGEQVEKLTQWTSYVIVLMGVASSGYEWLNHPSLIFLPTLWVGMIFLWLAGRCYGKISHNYDFLTGAVMTAIILHVRIMSIGDPINLYMDARTGLLFALLAMGMWAVARITEKNSPPERNTTNFPLDGGVQTEARTVRNLCHKTLCVMAAILSLTAAGQQLLLLSAIADWHIAPLNILTTALSGLALLLANHKLGKAFLSFIGIFLASLTLLWIEAAIFHSSDAFSLRPVDIPGDQWISLACLSLGLAFLSHYANRYSRWKKLYAEPLWFASVSGFIWVLMKTVPAFADGFFGENMAFYAPMLFLLQGTVLFPLLSPLSNAKQWRGVGILLFLSAFVISLFSLSSLQIFSLQSSVFNSYLLWGLANSVLPRFNARWPGWAVSPGVWPWAGLFSIMFCQPIVTHGIAFSDCSYWLALSGYLFLMLKNSSWQIFPYLAAGALNAAGLLLIGEYSEGMNLAEPGFFAFGTLLWANVLLCLASFWHRYEQIVTKRMGWAHHDLTPAFRFWPCLMLCTWLILPWLNNLFVYERFVFPSLPLWFGASLTLSFLHMFLVHSTRFYAHSFLLAAFNMVLIAGSFIYLPLLLTLWGLLLLVWHMLSERRKDQAESVSVICRALSVWLGFSPWPAITALLLVPVKSLALTLLTMGMLAGIMARMGYRKQSFLMSVSARIMGLALLHTWPFMLLPTSSTKGLVLLNIWPLLVVQFERLQILFPWYALQLGLLIWILPGLHSLLKSRFGEKWPGLKKLRLHLRFETGLAFGEWLLHTILFAVSMPEHGEINSSGIAALIAAGLFIAKGIGKIRGTQKAGWVYATALMGGIAGIYLRLVCAGLAPMTMADTMTIIGTAYSLFMLGRFISSEILSESFLRMAFWLPLFALMTLFLQRNPGHVSAILVALGALYLSLRFATGSSPSLYMGVVMLNAAVYLQIPAWAEEYSLIQLYVVPACLSVLLLLHLHRHELKQSVMNATRLAAISTLYACATLDFFLQDDLFHFTLALLLSLAGVAGGIAFRIRAFLYAGIIFMVMNVMGQLFFFYSAQSLGKGVLLVGMGTLIMAGMIWFNVQREIIIRRFRIFQTELESWE